MVKLVWVTPNPEGVIGYCARVSNPANQANTSVEGLLRYCIRNKHWSVFEMAGMCIEINTTRDIARQVLRHRSFHFQEFSQRYADVGTLVGPMYLREARLQDTQNRQNSIETDDANLSDFWATAQRTVAEVAMIAYRDALENGIAKEVARAVLPEGLTPSRMYVNATVRDWLHYADLRDGNGTQKEHMLIARQVKEIIRETMPVVYGAMWGGE